MLVSLQRTENRSDKEDRAQTTENVPLSRNPGDNRPSKSRVSLAGPSKRLASSSARPVSQQSKGCTSKISLLENQEQLREVKRQVTRGAVAQRPRTASVAKRSSRALAAKFTKWLYERVLYQNGLQTDLKNQALRISAWQLAFRQKLGFVETCSWTLLCLRIFMLW